MNSGTTAVLEAISLLVERLPRGAVEPLADAIADARPGAWPAIQAQAQRAIAAPQYREQVGVLLTTWRIQASDLPPASVALALKAAAHAVAQQRQAQTLELVWTGPGSAQPLRRTAQVLQDLIEAAQRDLLIVSFAVYDIPEIGQALLRAAQRGVQLRLVIELPKESAGRLAYDSLAAFGPLVTAHAQIYCWPAAERPTDDAGRHGSLHAKCAVADSQTLLISSANLTQYALSLNMELGILVRGGHLPATVNQHFTDLVQRRVLQRVQRQLLPPDHSSKQILPPPRVDIRLHT